MRLLLASLCDRIVMNLYYRGPYHSSVGVDLRHHRRCEVLLMAGGSEMWAFDRRD